MPIIIGTDEAGYGPNLGALAVSATRWKISSNTAPFTTDGLSDRILADFQNRLDLIGKKGGLFPMIDSKKLYHSKGSLLPLERSVFLALSLIEENSIIESLSLRDLKNRICSNDRESFWEKDQNPMLPVDLSDQYREEMKEDLREIQSYLKKSEIKLEGVRSRRVVPREFNKELDSGKLKSDILAETTISLVMESLKDQDEQKCGKGDSEEFAIVLCDKLGGRNNYRGLLCSCFPDHRLEIQKESDAVSIYHLYPYGEDGDSSEYPSREIRFTAKGESWFPTALSSLFSKYLRELSMDLFNRYWLEKKPDLLPTAGYPVDARRFYAEIASLRKELAIRDDDLWRKK
ncbi:MAG: hypothetical protein Q4G69_01600 [Planctomycetia bacterium]|nr:hypothetical protein [Planctomycetia bacterium]